MARSQVPISTRQLQTLGAFPAFGTALALVPSSGAIGASPRNEVNQYGLQQNEDCVCDQ
jgi:hypothetical protein